MKEHNIYRKEAEDQKRKLDKFGVEKAGLDKASAERQGKGERSEKAEPVAPAGNQD